ncbi:uncharacterized protein METZ01_LOCUS306672 [marine metagenome]|jgi:Na+-translocating ferredoxin:NAD+ oxidoreductase RnfA subunit|uniref:Virion structural protein n=1 Tax=marine metagenome TaxID=408172 RepID=A0A382MZQ3_9ZZZZ|tara:strand:+ start:63792 stop:64121 length:330 start_codon:yes stop_codon:yes gene_type:complete
MATYFKNAIVKNIGTLPVTIYTPPVGTNAIVLGLNLANLISSVVKVSVTLQDLTSASGFLIKDVMIAPNSSLRVLSAGEKLIVAAQSTLSVNSDITDSVDVVASYVELT